MTTAKNEVFIPGGGGMGKYLAIGWGTPTPPLPIEKTFLPPHPQKCEKFSTLYLASSHLIFSLFIRMIEIEPATSAKTQ